MRILFIMDEPSRIQPDRDTTFALMCAACERGFEVGHTRREWIWHRTDKAYCRWHPAQALKGKSIPDHLVLGDAQEGSIEEHDAVLVRTDPPFDLEYVKLTWLLDSVDPARTFIMNNPRGIRDASEKLYSLRFPDLTPLQMVTRDIRRLEVFLSEVDGKMVIKPIDWMGGYGVLIVDKNDPNWRALLELSTRDGRDLIVAQEYLPEAKTGDKRILLLNGSPIGALLRVPVGGEHRGNIHVGARIEKATIDDDDQKICDAIAPLLVENGLYFVGLDVIGGKLTEVNVTSPTGLQEIERFDDSALSDTILDFLLSKAEAK